MVNSEIWMASGATVSMIPEQEINLGTFSAIGAKTTGNQRVITLNTTFTGNFTLLTNLYRGCYLNIYKDSDDSFTDRVLINSNTGTTLTVNNSLSFLSTDAALADASAYYGVIEQFGSPVPAPQVTASTNEYTKQVISVQFKSDTKADYNDVGIIFGTVDAESASPNQEDVGIFFTSDGTFANAALLLAATEFDITVDISNPQLTTAEEFIDAAIQQINLTSGIDFSAIRDGDKLVITNTYGGAITRTAGTDDGGADSAIDSLDTADTTKIELTVTTVGATSATGNPRLLSDSWLGLATAVTVPVTNVTVEQMNLVAGGTRDFHYQYKSLEETSGGSLTLTANSFWPLYYALGRKTISTESSAETTLTPSSQFALATGTGTGFIYSTSKDKIHRTDGTKICPPLGTDDALTGYRKINSNDVENDMITYVFSEENGHQLPSFALEYTLKKGSNLTTVEVDDNKENVYTKIYPGTVVGSLSLDATADGPVSMNVSLAHKNTFVVAPSTNYETFNGVTDVKNFTNYRGREGTNSILGGSGTDTDADTEALMRPYFFADGTISLFGQDYIRIASMTLSIDNQLTAQRYFGRYDKNSQNHLNGQRTYNLSFTGHVTDAQVFDELQSQLTTALTDAHGSRIVLRFTKDNGEELEMIFKDYMVTSATFPTNNDRGPIMVDWVIQPLQLESCTHTTYWAIQG